MLPSLANLSQLTARRAVVTGLGMVNPLGASIAHSWPRMLNGESGIGLITQFDTSNLPCKVVGAPPREGPGAFNPADYGMEEKDCKRMDRFIQYSVAATSQALDDSGLLLDPNLDRERIGVAIGSGIGGMVNIEASVLKFQNDGRVSPLFIPSSLINLASGNIAIKYKFSGLNLAHCAACASGLQAISEAAKAVILGDADVMVAGGGEAAISPTSMAGFSACRALSTAFNDDPQRASRPWDKKRDGFVMGEGAGVLIIEEYESARRRNAKIYCEIVGSGTRADVHHITLPDPNGAGAYKTMNDALLGSRLSIDDIDYVNAHATSTPAGDATELLAVSKIFNGRKKQLRMSSLKSSIGHLLGASGSAELICSILAMRDGVIPPTLNLDDPIDSMGIDLVPKFAQQHNLKAIMSNAFGFGGINVSVIIKAV